MEPKGSYNNIPPIPHSRSTGTTFLQGPRNQSYGQRSQQQQQQQLQWHRHSSDGILLELTPAQRLSLSRESSNHDPNSNSNPDSNLETHSNFSSENNKAANFNTEITSDTLSRGGSYLEPPANLGGPVQYGSRAESETLGASQREVSGSISDEQARVIHINDPDRTNDNYEYAGNTVRTSKYTVLTFIPRNMFEQFHRIAYIYFLILIILNQLPWLAVFSSATSALPLAFVLLVTAFKDGYEDWRRHKSDKRENSRTALVWENGSFQPKEWQNIKVGEVIKVQANETLPCDVVLLSTSDPSGVAYVQTINLDGESNLKIRYAKQETASRMHGEGEGIVAGIIRCEKPNRNIYKFHGNIELDRKKTSLGSANIVLRGCELKNTAWIIGVVIYAGQETKVMLNSSGAPSKRSRLEAYMNRETLYLAGFLTVLCATMGIGMGLWLGRHKDELDTSPYYRKRYYNYDDKKEEKYKYYGIAPEVIFTMLTGVIIFQIMIPISLYISMELVRLGQAFFMIRDRKMYDSQSKSNFQCRALNINEDLGQIGYVFSDKTGTLTENKMEFRNASVCGRNYSPSNFRTAEPASNEEQALPEFTCSIEGKYLKLKMGAPVDPDLLQILNQQKNTEESRFVRDYFLSLAACNTIVPIIHETAGGVGIIEYQGESPDEQALAYAAASYGYVLIERSTGHIIIYVQGKKQRFDILGLHEFDSERKRMSVIVRSPDKSLKLLVKGADSSMLSAVDRSVSEGSSNYLVSATESHLYDYASQGLRTLVMGYRDLTIAEFESWRRKYEEANNALIGRARRIREIANSMECNLTLLGASGIEDRLQHAVPETIESLRKAGIKVWVLTGDKQETAISIAISCKLIVPSMQQIIINGKNREDCHRRLQEEKSKYGITRAEGAISVLKKWKNMKFCFGDRVDSVPMSSMAVETPITDEHPSRKSTDREQSPLALIIDGTSLVHILESDLEDELYDIAIQCRVVLCCRVAPLQKAGIVALIKKRTSDLTLAIGDGANDVSMIQMADVGVGISGQEGRQAVMASDFAMGQFRFLEQLLLVHGHWNYDRMSYMILYNFYRNAIYVFVAFWYVLHTGFTATTAVTDWSGVLYSVIYSALPTIIVAIMDQDLEPKTLIQNPKVYNYGQAEKGYNAYLFWLTMLDTVWQSLVIAYVGYFSYRHSTVDIWSMGSLWTIAVVLIVNLHLAMDVQSWTFLTHIAIWASILFTWICLLIIDSIPVLPNYGVFYHVVTWGSYWLNLIIAVWLALLPRLLVKFVKQRFCPSDIQILREQEISNKKLERSTLEINQINECS